MFTKFDLFVAWWFFRLTRSSFVFFCVVAVSKRISKIVQSEGKAEKNSLRAAIGELKGIQKMQRVAVKVIPSFHVTVRGWTNLGDTHRKNPQFTPHT